MWIITGGVNKKNPAVFLSVVQHFDDENLLVVRARDRDSLKRIAKYVGETIQSTPNNDYPFRLIVSRATLALYLNDVVWDQLYYTNVKEQVTKTRGQVWHDALLRVWHALQVLSPVGKGGIYDWRVDSPGPVGVWRSVGPAHFADDSPTYDGERGSSESLEEKE